MALATVIGLEFDRIAAAIQQLTTIIRSQFDRRVVDNNSDGFKRWTIMPIVLTMSER